MVDLLRDRPLCGIQVFPARFESCEIFFSLIDASPRPIADSTGPFETVDIVACKWRVSRTPRPEIIRQFFQRVRPRMGEGQRHQRTDEKGNAKPFASDHARSVFNPFSRSNLSIARCISLSINSL